VPTTVPILQVLYRRKNDIRFGWKPLPAKDAKSFNLYAGSSETGPFTLLKSNIPNIVNKGDYKGKVTIVIKDEDIPIPENLNVPPLQGGVVRGTKYYFKLTFVDKSSIESNIANSDPIVVWPHGVEPFFENENEVQNEHLFGWVPERHRWEKILLTDDGKLITDADVTVDVGNITLSNVKVAARTDGTTLEYLLVDDLRKLIIRQDPFSNTPLSDYEETAAVARNVETTIFTYSNISKYKIKEIICSGTGDAVFKLKVGGTTIRTLRSSWNDRNQKFEFGIDGREIPAGMTITVTAEHDEPNPQKFEASFEGFKFSI